MLKFGDFGNGVFREYFNFAILQRFHRGKKADFGA